LHHLASASFAYYFGIDKNVIIYKFPCKLDPLPCILNLQLKITINKMKQTKKIKTQAKYPLWMVYISKNITSKLWHILMYDLPSKFAIQKNYNFNELVARIELYIHTIMKFVLPLTNGLLIMKILQCKKTLLIKFDAQV